MSTERETPAGAREVQTWDLIEDPTVKQLVFAYEMVLTEMRTYAGAGDRQITEWVRRLDFERDEFARTALAPQPRSTEGADDRAVRPTPPDAQRLAVPPVCNLPPSKYGCELYDGHDGPCRALVGTPGEVWWIAPPPQEREGWAEEKEPITDCPECNGDGLAPDGPCICRLPTASPPVPQEREGLVARLRELRRRLMPDPMTSAQHIHDLETAARLLASPAEASEPRSTEGAEARVRNAYFEGFYAKQSGFTDPLEPWRESRSRRAIASPPVPQEREGLVDLPEPWVVITSGRTNAFPTREQAETFARRWPGATGPFRIFASPAEGTRELVERLRHNLQWTENVGWCAVLADDLKEILSALSGEPARRREG